MEMWITLAGIIITGAFSTIGAIINSNARAEVMEQKFTDMFTAFDKEQSEIKENITVMSAALNQLKAESRLADELQIKTNMLMLRHSINEGYRVFKEKGSIDQKSKDSLLALGDVYINDYKGNTFVQDELEYLRTLKVV